MIVSLRSSLLLILSTFFLFACTGNDMQASNGVSPSKIDGEESGESDTPSSEEESEVGSGPDSTPQPSPPANQPSFVCQNGDKRSESCADQISNSKSAFVELVCAPNRLSFVQSKACSLVECKSGFEIKNNNCVATNQPKPICNTGQTRKDPCGNQISNSKVAFIGLVCAPDRMSFVVSKACTVEECNGGFEIKNNSCVASKPTQQPQVFVDKKFHNPLVAESDRWSFAIDKNMSEVIDLGVDGFEELNPLRLPIKIENPTDKSLSVSAKATPEGFAIDGLPASVASGSSMIFYVSPNVKLAGDHQGKFTFSLDSQEYALNLKASVKIREE